jgi:hypothetical protein
LLAFAVCVAAPAWAQHEISWFSVGGGGGHASGGGYELTGTLGQPDAGMLTGGDYTLGGGFWAGGATSVVGVRDAEPMAFRLEGPSPNPLVHHSVLTFELPEARNVRVAIYDLAGRRTRTLAEGNFPVGRHQRTWDGRDDAGRPVATGVYFVRFDAGPAHDWRRIVVIR